MVLVAVCVGVIYERLELSYDLAYFLPAAKTAEERVLHDRAGDGPGARLIFAVVVSPEAERAQRLAAQLADNLSGAKELRRAHSVPVDTSPMSIPSFVWNYRYLLDDRSLTLRLLTQEIEARIADLVLLPGDRLASIVSSDPTLASLHVLHRFGGGLNFNPNFAFGGDFGALVVAESVAPAFDLDGQRRAVESLEAAFADLGESGARLEVFGMGVYGLAMQDTIRNEARYRSLAATALVTVVLLIAFRRLRLVALAGVPIALGFIAGLAAISLGFGRVHGITLAFGATILGITVDYPLHLLSHARSGGAVRAAKVVLPVVWIGALSTAIAFFGLAVTGSSGLSQLAVFSLTGVLVAASATRWLLPGLLTETELKDRESNDGVRSEPRLRYGILLVSLPVLAFLSPWESGYWSNDLSAMTPIPAETLRRDHALRQLVGTPDLRYLIAAEADSMEGALRASELASDALEMARMEGLVQNWLSPSDFFPSLETQLRRRDQLPGPEKLRAWVDAATEGSPFEPNAFAPFLEDVETAKSLELTMAEVLASDFGSTFKYLLYESGPRWVSITSLFGASDAVRLADWLSDHGSGGAFSMFDLKRASESLVARYKAKTAIVVAVALVAILVLLLATNQSLSRAIWIVSTTLAGVGLTVVAVAAAVGPLSVFHFVALLVVVGLGLDYALFYSRPATDTEARDTRHAVLAGVASTSATFGVLAWSSIPVLSAIGSTIATGCLICWLLSRLGATRSA